MALEAVDNLKEGLFNINFVPIIGGMAAALKFIVIIAIIGIATWFLIRNLKFKHQVVIYEKIGNSFRMVFDRGKFVDGKGGKYFSLLKAKKRLSPPKLDYFFPIRKLFTKSAIAYYKHSDDSFVPVEASMKEKSMGLQPVEQKKNLFLQARVGHEAKQKTEGFWKTYGRDLILFGCLGMFIMLLIFGADTIQGLAATAGGAVERSAELMERLAQSVNQLNACTPPPN